MKAYIRPTLTHRERQIAAAEMDKITRKGICRAQWLMLIAFALAFATLSVISLEMIDRDKR